MLFYKEKHNTTNRRSCGCFSFAHTVMTVAADSHRIPYYLPKMDRTQRLLFN